MAPYGGWVGQTQHKVHHFFSQIFATNRELQKLEKFPSISMLNQGHRIPHLIYNTYPPAKTPSNLQLLKIKTYVWILYDRSPLWCYLMQVNLKTLAPKEEAKAVPLARMCIDKCICATDQVLSDYSRTRWTQRGFQSGHASSHTSVLTPWTFPPDCGNQHSWLRQTEGQPHTYIQLHK